MLWLCVSVSLSLRVLSFDHSRQHWELSYSAGPQVCLALSLLLFSPSCSSYLRTFLLVCRLILPSSVHRVACEHCFSLSRFLYLVVNTIIIIIIIIIVLILTFTKQYSHVLPLFFSGMEFGVCCSFTEHSNQVSGGVKASCFLVLCPAVLPSRCPAVISLTHVRWPGISTQLAITGLFPCVPSPQHCS